jgi:hypothetical protein
MKTFECICGNRLFYENSRCLSCEREVGWCPQCHEIVALIEGSRNELVCGRPECGAALVKCHNYAVENVCNRCCLPTSGQAADPLCDSCRLTEVIPDLTVPGNREKWYRLEVAKRRLLYLLDLLRLSYGRKEEAAQLPLSFDFKSDITPASGLWRTMSGERVYTGHQNGKVTINIREADDAEREKLRVDMNEAHRTLCGHFRHEIGHYYWQLLVPQKRDAKFAECFGDPDHPPYAEALERYYRDGAQADWKLRFVSAYATMHPWEDFAETFALYLDMVEVLDTASQSDLVAPVNVTTGHLDQMISRYLELAVKANELNRSMRLLDLVPEVLTADVRCKLTFVHDLVRSAHGNPTAVCAARLEPPSEIGAGTSPAMVQTRR